MLKLLQAELNGRQRVQPNVDSALKKMDTVAQDSFMFYRCNQTIISRADLE